MKKIFLCILVIFLCNTILCGQSSIHPSQLVGKVYSTFVDLSKIMEENPQVQKAVTDKAKTEEEKESSKKLMSLFTARITITFKSETKLKITMRALFDDEKAKSMGIPALKRVAVKSAIKTMVALGGETFKYELKDNNVIADGDNIGTLSEDLSTFILKDEDDPQITFVCKLQK